MDKYKLNFSGVVVVSAASACSRCARIGAARSDRSARSKLEGRTYRLRATVPLFAHAPRRKFPPIPIGATDFFGPSSADATVNCFDLRACCAPDRPHCRRHPSSSVSEQDALLPSLAAQSGAAETNGETIRKELCSTCVHERKPLLIGANWLVVHQRCRSPSQF